MPAPGRSPRGPRDSPPTLPSTPSAARRLLRAGRRVGAASVRIALTPRARDRFLPVRSRLGSARLTPHPSDADASSRPSSAEPPRDP